MTDPIPAQAADGQTPPNLGQGAESLEAYQKFFQDLSPLLTELDKNPELVKAIVENKLTPEFAKAALEGKLSVAEAQAAQTAVQEVKTEVGTKAFENMTPDKLAELVDEKMSSFEKKMEEKQGDKEFQAYTSEFIKTTSDFEKYADPVAKWLEEHPEITDVKVAYYAVKGELSEKEAKDAVNKDAADQAKNIILNAQGGGVTSNFAPDGTPMIDRLIASRSNPNSF